jgi:hypothetical protein
MRKGLLRKLHLGFAISRCGLRLHRESEIFQRDSQKWMAMTGKGKKMYVTIFRCARVLSQHPITWTSNRDASKLESSRGN